MLRNNKKKNKKFAIQIQPEFFSESYWLTKFLNKLMQRGRKDAVKKIVFCVFKKIKIKHHKDASKIIFLALVKNRPLLTFVSIRLGREKKKVPFPLAPRRQLVISLTWLILAIKLLRFRNYNVSVEKVLYGLLKSILYKEKNIFTTRRVLHNKELIENRVNAHLIHKFKKK